MKRDIVIAIIVGFIIGGIAALGIANLPKILKEGKSSSEKSLSPSPSPIDSKTLVSGLDFTIDEPKDDTIVNNKTIKISGKAKEGLIIIMETPSEQKVVDKIDSGSFTTELRLTEGANNIHITAYDESGVSNTKTLTVYYSSEKL